MKKINRIAVTGIIFFTFLVFGVNPGHASDTCMFEVTADDVPPNIVILIDNGAEMKHPVPHGDYDSSVDYTPDIEEVDKLDVVPYGNDGNGFYNDNGYAIFTLGVAYYLVPVNDQLELNTEAKLEGLPSADKKTSKWTINGREIYLPAEASAEVDADGVKDNAGLFRYSKNYLNWLYFYTSEVDLNGDGLAEPFYDFTPLPSKSRFYYAKQALLSVGKLSSNKAKFAIYNFTSTSEGSSSVQPLGDVVTTLGATAEDNILDPNYINNINNMGTVIYSPLAEGMATIGGYLDSPSAGSVDSTNYCQKNFVIVVSPGMSSEDTSNSNQSIPDPLKVDHDGDGNDGHGDYGPGQGTLTVDGSDYTIVTNYNGSTYMDDVAHYFYTHDMRISNDTTGGFQNTSTYTVGFMATTESRLFLINTSNNGNGNPNLTVSTDPEYGKYHFEAGSADGLSQAVLDAFNSIISRTSSFTAPVVPVTRTTSGNKIYMAFFKPLEQNFWQGNLTKFGLNADNQIIGSDDNPATWANGSMREDAKPYWATIDWADISKSNGILNSSRSIYTYLGSVDDLTDPANRFATNNTDLTAMMLGNPSDVTVNDSTVTGRDKVINYIRGADVLDEDSDGDSYENRSIITGDVLHSEPMVFTYRYADLSTKTLVFFGANDGMLHAVLDVDGSEAWAFIPPNQLNRLKYILEGTTHTDFIDGSPKVYFHDVDADGLVEPDDGDQVILVCGQRKGGSGYFALDITDPDVPKYLWRIGNSNDAATDPDVIIPALGESWSEPEFGLVKTTDADTSGTPVCFIGGGYSADNSAGKAMVAVDLFSGAVVRKFTAVDADTTDLDKTTDTAMNFSVPSSVKVVDEDGNGFVDKVYVGDLGGQMWRFGQVTVDTIGNPLTFPDCDENINNWTGQIMFTAPTYVIESTTYRRKFFYPPSVTLEKGYDMLFMGTGDRENACDTTTAADRIYAIKETHGTTSFTETNLVDVTDPAAAVPDLNQTNGDVDSNNSIDQGWFIRLVDSLGADAGEKVLAQGVVFYKTFYITTFSPNNDPCVPGGNARLYALNYLTGSAKIEFTDIDGDGDDDLTRSVMLGGGIPSKPVIVLTPKGEKLFISVGSTNPNAASQSIGAGITGVDPLFPNRNFFYLWWRELFN